LKHYSIRTEQAYAEAPSGRRGQSRRRALLTHLAVERNVAASTRNQALSAIVFLYKEVLGRELGMALQRRAREAPGVGAGGLTEAEVRAVLAQRDGRHALMAGSSTVPGSGSWSVRLRVKDVDFGYSQITVRDGKGEKDRVTILPALLQHTSWPS